MSQRAAQSADGEAGHATRKKAVNREGTPMTMDANGAQRGGDGIPTARWMRFRRPEGLALKGPHTRARSLPRIRVGVDQALPRPPTVDRVGVSAGTLRQFSSSVSHEPPRHAQPENTPESGEFLFFVEDCPESVRAEVTAHFEPFYAEQTACGDAADTTLRPI